MNIIRAIGFAGLAFLLFMGAGCEKCVTSHKENRYRAAYVTYPYIAMKGAMKFMPQYHPGYWYEADVCDSSPLIHSNKR